MICPHCATEYTDEATCPVCGRSPEPPRCEGCGERYPGDEACPACGRARAEFPCLEHPEERAEGRCVICGRALCGRCRRGDTRTFLCADHEHVTVMQGWAQIYSTTREFEAQLLSENLQAEGIEARIFSQRDNMLSVDLGELSIVRLLVPVWEYEAGLALIREHMDTSGEVSFACPECGEAYEAGAESCASCGAVLA